MGGYWSIANVSNCEELWGGDFTDSGFPSPKRENENGKTQWLDAVTSTLIWYMPLAKIDEITNENYQDVFMKIHMIQIVLGPSMKDSTIDYIDLNDIKRRVGLKVGPGVKLAPMEELLIEGLKNRAKEALDEQLTGN